MRLFLFDAMLLVILAVHLTSPVSQTLGSLSRTNVVGNILWDSPAQGVKDKKGQSCMKKEGAQEETK